MREGRYAIKGLYNPEQSCLSAPSPASAHDSLALLETDSRTQFRHFATLIALRSSSVV